MPEPSFSSYPIYKRVAFIIRSMDDPGSDAELQSADELDNLGEGEKPP